MQSPLGAFAARGSAAATQAPVTGTEAHLARQVLSVVEGRYRVVYSGRDVERVERVARSLVPVTERSNVDFTFGVVETREYNAFALPGGYVYITRPLLEMLDTDAELAAVLSHEMVHICHLHAVGNYERQIGLTVTAMVVGAVTGKMQSAADMLDLLGQILDVGYSYSQEYDADSTGMVYLMKAGYPMEGMQSLLNRLSSLERALGDNKRGFSRTHPPTESRMGNARQKRQELAVYETVNTYLRWRMRR
ncbi:MAG: M48 family metalloprotease [Limnochordia bacterium]